MDQLSRLQGILQKSGVLDLSNASLAPTPPGRPLAPSNRAVTTQQASNAQYIHGHNAASVGGAIPAGAGNAHMLPHKLPSQAHVQGPALSPYQQQIAVQALAQAQQQRSAAEHQRLQELLQKEQQRYAERNRLLEEENRQMNERRMQQLQAMGATSGQPLPTRPAPVVYKVPNKPTKKQLQAQQRREQAEALIRRNAALAAGLQPQQLPPTHIGGEQPAWPPPSATPPNPAAAAAANLAAAAAAAAAAARAAAASGSSAATAISVDDEEGADTGLGDGVEEQLFANVSTAELEAAGLRPHPDRISETSALASVCVPRVDYRMSLPLKVLHSKQVGEGVTGGLVERCMRAMHCGMP